uniref:DUF4371 domain-containing protein n=1 Tax=Pundamilia nyererei TaxID=303518 RepID=A0A3B4ESV8_9CICH
EDWGFVQQKDRAVCALCLESVVCQTSSVKRHFETKHQKTFKDEAEKVESITHLCQDMRTSYRIAHCIAKHGKPFTDGKFVKEAFLSSSEVLFNGLPKKDAIKARIQDIPASARTVERRIQEMGDNVRAQQTAGLREAQVFGVALDESVDINDGPHLAVMVRYCDVAVQKELFYLTPMPETTRGEDIAKVFKECFDERGIDITKIFAVTTDGAPAVVEKHRGAVTLIEEQVGHPIMKLHCIIHQENLCSKMSNSDLHDVMPTVAKVMNFIVKRSPLTHRQFQSLLEEMDSSCKDIPLHCAVRWLKKGQSHSELEDEKWVEKRFFLTDIMGHLNKLNLKLQGSGQTVLDMRDTWEAFVQKLFSSDVETSMFCYFKRLRELSAQHSISTSEIHGYVQRLEKEFRMRFLDFQVYGPMFSFLIKPESFNEQLDLSLFKWLDTDDMEMQLIELKSSTLESTAAREPGACIFTCWTSLPDKFNCLKNISQALLTVFGSTYLCEQIVLSASRCRLTAGHSETCVLLKVTKCDPQIIQLANTKQGQGSH